jgi:hypothetical protein
MKSDPSPSCRTCQILGQLSGAAINKSGGGGHLLKEEITRGKVGTALVVSREDKAKCRIPYVPVGTDRLDSGGLVCPRLHLGRSQSRNKQHPVIFVDTIV